MKHEVSEVTSGYRWVLTYNLVYSGHIYEPLSAADNTRDARFLAAVFDNWREDINNDENDHVYTGDPPPEELIYLLDHQHTDESPRFSALKGKDLVKAQLLRDVCDQTDFCVYLASLERKVYGGVEDDYDEYYGRGFGYYDDEESENGDSEDEPSDFSKDRPTRRYASDFHEIIDECDKSLKLKRIVDFAGRVVGTEFDVDEDNIIQDEPFKDREPDEEDFEGYTGNEGASTTHWYRNTVSLGSVNPMYVADVLQALVLVPKEYDVSFRLRPFAKGPRSEGRLEEPSLQIDGVIQRLEEKVGRDPQNKDLQEELIETCRFVMGHNIDHWEHVYGRWGLEKKERFPDSTVGEVVKASLLLRRPALFNSATRAVDKHLPLSCFSDVGALLRACGFAVLRKG